LTKYTPSKPNIRCGSHGFSPASAICKHLCQETGLGYFAITLAPNHPCVGQAWCEKCHAVLEEEGGWTDRSKKFADLRLVCTSCYEKVLSKHARLELVA
jgi:hypothetical protein